MSSPQRLAGLRICGGGNRAGIHDDDVGIAAFVHQPVARARKLLRQHRAVRLVQLASVGLYRNGPGLGRARISGVATLRRGPLYYL